MLHYETIDTKTLGLLKRLLQVPEFSDLRLAGGTSLALQIGHRKSVDIDLFGKIKVDSLTIAKILDKVGDVTILKKSDNINIYIIDKIKVDIVNYHYNWIDNKIISNELILASKKEISAMKLAAITGRGTKKDFIDLFFLLKEYKLAEILNFYKEKYPDGSEFLVLKSLLYFEDAETNETPEMFKPESWGNIKKTIISSVENYIQKNSIL
ncbi:MAG: nucleotidyl transferase AbiEii/AbiGii toxin family protein [Bacteroidales bacterium]|nr:nucleotidyl transferase AbiEii/AbiGii toxin family protein [Bacteroidales bacterium]